MSDIKRVALTTLEPQKVNDKVIKKLCKTVRISVILPESNEDNCPEYNYKDQLAAVVKKKTKPPKDTNGVENGLDPFGENDEDVRRIALEMEAKYGSGVTKKKRKDRKDDYADIGMGYDESDSFIDNTDGYDEIIPKNVTTLHGGFYVNSGALEFKTDNEASSDASTSASSSAGTSSASESEGEDKQKTKSRKRILETSADSDSDTANPAQKEKKLKLQSPTTSMQQAIKKKMFSSSKIQVKKRRSSDPHKTVKDLLREKREDLNLSIPDELKTVEDNIEKESSKENKKPMNITSVTDAIESVLKQVVEEDYDKNQNKTPVEVNINATQNKIDPSNSQSKDKDKPNLSRLEKEEIVKLPENLPGDIDGILTKLKEAAINYKGEGKKAFFTQEVNSLLLNLEKKSKIISKSSRVKVYEHLAQYVNCTKDTLTRRARVLDLEDNERRLRNLQSKLKDCIDSLMPTLEENFQQESQKVLQKKFSKESENTSEEELKNLKLPRRKFRWNEETKKHLKDVVSIKKRCLVLEGNKTSLLEEQLVEYLRKHVLPLWPQGWMYINNIKKILNSMQGHTKSSSQSSNDVTVDSSNHSNISITPVTNGKSNQEKPEITNSITVTKVVNNNETVSKDLEDKKIDDTEEILVNEHSKSNENQPKVESNEKIADLTMHPKKTEVFKPYVDDPVYSQVKKIFCGKEETRNYSKPQKPNEMFKPYADEVISIERNVPEKKYENNLSARAEIIPKYPDKNKSSTEKEKLAANFYDTVEKLGRTGGKEKNKQDGEEKDKYGEKSYQEKEKHGKSYHDKDKHGGHHSHHEKNKHYSYHDKDKHQEKDKHVGHSHHEKDKHSGHLHHEKDKHSVRSYMEKDKQAGHSYNNKEKSIKENPGSAIHNYSKKDKYSAHSYVDKVKHSDYPYVDPTYSEQEKSHSYNDKQSQQMYQEKEKYNSHIDKHNLKDRKVDEKPTNPPEITPQIDLTQLVDKPPSSTKPIEKSPSLSKPIEKQPSSTKPIEKPPGLPKPIEKPSGLSKPIEKPPGLPKPVEKPPGLLKPIEKPPGLPKPIEKPTDLSKFQMFKPYSDTPKSLLDDLTAYQSKDVNCYKLKEERHHSTKTISQDASNFPNKSFAPTDDFVSSRSDVSTTKHRPTNTHSYQGGNNGNNISSKLDDCSVIVKNAPPKDKLPREDKKESNLTVIPTTTHCQGVKRKLLETYAINSNEINPANHYSPVFPIHQDYVPHAPLVTGKSDGDGQKDIQMVMENLKALQKLSCSPVKNDNSSNSPVSVIAYNKSFSNSKTNSNHSHSSRNEVNNRVGTGGDLASGFQDEFQKAFINSLQQLAAQKPSYNNGS